MSIEITIPPATQTRMAQLRKFPAELLPAIVRGMDRGGQLALGKITIERFSGDGPFPVIQGKLGVGKNTPKHRGGQLRASLRVTPARIFGNQVVSRAGSPVVYFGVHEFGFNGQVHVPAFTRRVKSRDVRAVKLTKSGKVSKTPGKLISKGTGEVRAHQRWLSMPARAPFGHGLADHLIDFTREIAREVADLWDTKNKGGQV